MTDKRALHDLAGVTPVNGATGKLPHYLAEGTPLALCKRRTGSPLTIEELGAVDRFCSHCVKAAEKLAADRPAVDKPEIVQGAVARDFADSIASHEDRNTEIRALADAAGLTLAHDWADLDPHFARPGAETTQCGHEVARFLSEELAARVSVLCSTCERDARMLKERLVDQARQKARRAAIRVRSNPNPGDLEWIEALDRFGGALDYLEKYEPVAAAAIRQGVADVGVALELVGLNGDTNEGDLLIAELARRGHHAHHSLEGGASYVIMAATPGAPADPLYPYGRPHVLMYAGERADRPAFDHKEPWSAHLYGANGGYVAAVSAHFPGRLGPLSDAARCASEVVHWLGEFYGDPQD